ncbi:hypothetical protein [Paracoccus binzhouensis]|uniref:hypothetical protein n=1 Tax=Paracoccus binzhouensis TaxID=2796149 RepID=UPI0018EF2F37|nr:hypothetical protein [Paracoccus binzhouensis]
MLPVFITPMRRFVRSQLFLTTALISLAGLPFCPGAARAEMYLDNVDPGDGEIEVEDGDWASWSDIWTDENGENADTLPSTEIGVLRGPVDDPDDYITLDIFGTVDAGGLTVEQGNFALEDGTLRAGGGSLAFSVAEGSTLRVSADVEGDMNVTGPGSLILRGDSSGDITSSGNLILWGRHDGNVANGNFLSIRDTLNGDVVNTGSLYLRGNVDGLVDNTAEAFVVGASSVENLTNRAGARLTVVDGWTLEVENTLENSGTLVLTGEIDGDVNTTVDGRLRLNNGRLEGDLANAGTLGGEGTIAGHVTNTGTVTAGSNMVVGSMTNDGTVAIGAGNRLEAVGSALQNNAQLTVEGNLAGGLDNTATGTVTMGEDAVIGGPIDNAGSMQIAGQILARLSNAHTVTTAGDVRVGHLVTEAAGTTTIGAGHELTADETVENRGRTNIDGTLTGDLLNEAGTTALRGGTVDGDVQNDATMTGHGRVTGTLDNSDSLTTTGNLRVGRLDNDGTTTVGAGHTLTADERISNDGTLNVAGAVTVTGSDGIRNNSGATLALTGATLTGNVTNDGTMQVDAASQVTGDLANSADLVLDGGQISGSVTNHGSMQVNASSRVTGDLTNRSNLTLDGTAGDVTLTVDGIFTNSGVVDGTNTGSTPSEMTIVADLVAVEDGAVVNNVNVIGDLLNRSTIIYDQDTFLDGNLTNDSMGEVTVSAGLDVRGNDIGNLGTFRIETDGDSAGAMTNVDALTNEGSFTITSGASASVQSVVNQGDGEMTVAGTLTSASTVDNQADLTVAGTLDAGLDNSGTAVLAGGTLGGAVTNSGQLQGNGTISGAVTNSGTMAMSGQVVGQVANTGTINQNGTLGVAGLVNDGLVNVASSGVLRSATTVQNNDRLTVAGQLDAALRNNAGGQVTLNGGAVTGAVGNAGEMTGSGTITGALTNSGSATIGGRLAAGVTNSGRLESAGTLSTASLANSGTVDVASGSTLQSDTAVQNGNQLRVAGRLAADLVNTGTAALSGGTIAGDVTNGGSLTGSGTIEGTLANTDTATIGGRVTGAVTNDGSLTSSGALSVAALTNNERLNVAGGSSLHSDSAVVNNGSVNLAGTLQGDLHNLATTTLAGGTVAGGLTNSGTLTGNGAIAGTLANSGRATIAGQVGRLENSGTLGLSGDLAVGTLVNDEVAEIAAGRTLTTGDALLNRDRLTVAGTLTGALDNRATTTLSGTIDGGVANSGTLSGSGRVTGLLRNSGTLTANGALTIGQLVNDEIVSIGAGSLLRSAATVQNNDRLGLAGTLEADLLNRAGGTVTLSDGTLRGDVGNLGTLTGQGTIEGVLQNAGTARIGGRAGTVENLAAGALHVSGALAAEGFVNAGTATIAASNSLTMADPDAAGSAVPAAAQNLAGGELTVEGTLAGSLANAGRLAGAGTITGSVLNRGTTDWSGRIGGTVTNESLLRLGGTVAGGLINQSGTLTTRDTATIQGGLRNESGAGIEVASGSTLITEAGTASLNAAGASFSLLGTLRGDLLNEGTLEQTGTLDGTLQTSGSATLGGRVTGDLIYDGGALTTRNGLAIGGDFVLNADHAIGAGSQIAAARTMVGSDSTLTLAGALDGALVNHGILDASGTQAHVTGTVTNDGTIDLEDDSTGGVLTVGGLSGSGTYALDVNLRDMTADRIVVDGGAARGSYYLSFDLGDRDTIPQSGERVTLIDVDESFGAQNDFVFRHDELPAGSERIVYSVEREGGLGNLDLVSQLNPAMGAIFGNVALVQSLIGSVVNRPTSPFVTSLAYEDKEKPCGIGSWGRAVGGHATANGTTDNGISKVASEVKADYYGMQVGTDLACFDDRFGGWDMAFGVLGGINRGSTSQPVYAINPNNSQDLTAILTSYTSTDFEQRYAGIYATATRERFQADLQYRYERTDFTIANDPLPGYTGLGLDETDFSSDAQTLSGSISYAVPIGDSGWAVLPTMGFAWSKMSTDSIPFEDGYRLSFKDSTRKIGFAGATVAKTFVQEQRNSALYAFATGTWYKDFADPTVSVFASDDPDFEPQVLKSENLGAYGEISVGANWVKVLGPEARGRQISAGARIDARFGDRLDSVGVSGQFRWQF